MEFPLYETIWSCHRVEKFVGELSIGGAYSIQYGMAAPSRKEIFMAVAGYSRQVGIAELSRKFQQPQEIDDSHIL